MYRVSSDFCVMSAREALTVQVVTYALIYDFLSRRSHTKAAEAVKKAANGEVALGATSESNTKLEDIVKGWKGSQAKPVAVQ